MAERPVVSTVAPPADPELEPPLLDELPAPELPPELPELPELLPLEDAPEPDPPDVEPEPLLEAPLEPPPSPPPAGDPLELEQALPAAARASAPSDAIDPRREGSEERWSERRGWVAMVSDWSRACPQASSSSAPKAFADATEAPR
jgi:hypothetical protein